MPLADTPWGGVMEGGTRARAVADRWQHSTDPAPPAILTLVRHGESEWNRSGRFAGWTDVDLSDHGVAQAARAGRLLSRSLRPVDVCFTSVLRRAVRTSEIALREMGQQDVPIQCSWRLNERHYGALQGLGVWRAVRRYGALQVLRCRKEFGTPPPALDPGDLRHPGHDRRYASLAPGDLPHGESVADAQVRLLPCWRGCIVPELARGRHVLVVSHKHTLRALLRLLRSRAHERIPKPPLRTGVPIVMVFHARDHWILDSGPQGGW